MVKKKAERKVKKPNGKELLGENVPEVKRTVLDEELESPLRKRPGHPSHKGYNRLNATEEASAKKKFAMTGKVRKSKQFDGRALRGKRPRTDQVMKTFYAEVDLPEFKEALQFSKDPKFLMLYQAISAPSLHRCSFAELCRRCGLTIHDISNIYRDHQKHRGLMRAFAHMPKILEDTAIDAQSRVVSCEMCGGEGKVTEEYAINRQKVGICPRCHGDGKVRILGDKDSRQLMFETAGLRKGGSVQAVQVNVGGAMPSLEDVIEDAEDALDVGAMDVGEKTPPSEETKLLEGKSDVRYSTTEGPEQIGEGSPEDEENSGGDDETGLGPGPKTVH